MLVPTIDVVSMQLFIKSIYHGTLNFQAESLHEIFDLFGIPYNVKNIAPHDVAAEEDDIAVDDDSEDDCYIEPELHLDVGSNRMELDDDEEEGLESDLEAKAQALKNKIFAECGIVPKSSNTGRPSRNTRNPSKIWKWFTKTPNFIYCKICGISIKNSGNTTNASRY